MRRAFQDALILVNSCLPWWPLIGVATQDFGTAMRRRADTEAMYRARARIRLWRARRRQNWRLIPARIHGETRFGWSARALRPMAVRSPRRTRAAARAAHARRTVVVCRRRGGWSRESNRGRGRSSRRRVVCNRRGGCPAGCATDRRGHTRWRGIGGRGRGGYHQRIRTIIRVGRMRRWAICVCNRCAYDRRRWRRRHAFDHGRRCAHAW